MAKQNKTASNDQTSANGLPLFYNKPVALDKKTHAGFSLTKNLTFDFAAKVNAVPVTMIELPSLMQNYPIAFSATSPATPLAILGLRDNENLFVNKKGEWQKDCYIPAYIRRYPFIFARNDNGDRLTLCVDDNSNILTKGNDNLLFDASGELTQLTNNALEYCRSYQAAAEQTEAFSQALEQSGILLDRSAEIRLSNGETLTLSGFRQIDETKFYALPKDTLNQWHDNRWIAFIYAHLFSIGNWQKLFQMMEQQK